METYTYKLVEDEHGNIQCGDKLYRFEETIKEDNKPSYEELESKLRHIEQYFDDLDEIDVKDIKKDIDKILKEK